MDNKTLHLKKLNDIAKKLLKYNYFYYNLSKSLISDYEYDQLQKQFENLKAKHNLTTKYDSLLKVGISPISKLIKKNHLYAMYSLQNCYNFEEIVDFDNRISKNLPSSPNSYFCEYKIDGVSISLEYQNYILKCALTRGDGEVGEDVTDTIKLLSFIPLKIPLKTATIRGEVFFNKDIDISLFGRENINETNLRNLASGTLRRLNINYFPKFFLKALFYDLKSDDEKIKGKGTTQKDIIALLKMWKFPVESHGKYCQTILDTQKYINEVEANRQKLNITIDGIVVKLNSLANQKKIGFTSRFPRWAIAYKFSEELFTTKLIMVSTTVGRTGKITYEALFTPVWIDGTKVSRATLHNYDYVKKLNLHQNDFIVVKKAAEIIPQVIGTVLEKRPKNAKIITHQTVCPCCKTPLISGDDLINEYCPNDLCDEKRILQIIHFCSKNAMNIETLSSQTIRLFYKYNYVKNITNLYTFIEKNSVNQLLEIFASINTGNRGIKEKTILKWKKEIKKSYHNSFERLLFGLGIKFMGKQAALIFAKHFKKLENVLTICQNDILTIHQIGKSLADSFLLFVKKNNDILEFFLKNEIAHKYIFTTVLSYDNLPKELLPFYNARGEITGKFSIKRSELILLFEKINCQLGSIVTKTTKFVLVGEKPTKHKIAEANKLSIRVINLSQAENLIKALQSQ